MTKKQDQCTILVAEDDEGDRFLIQKAMKDCGIANEVRFLPDGQALVDLLDPLETSAEDTQDRFPCLILMDLNMPRMDGREALKALKGNARLKEIPVVVLSSSGNPADIKESYRDGASSFFTKPMAYQDLVELMGLLRTYWFQTAQLPHQGN